MATCKECFHVEACSGFKPTDLDKDVWHYCKMGIPEEIPDIDKRCDSFKESKSWREVIRCLHCHYSEPSEIRNSIWCRKMCRYMKEDGFCSEWVKMDGA